MMQYRLGELTLTLRCLATFTLLVLGVGYGVAIVNLYYTYSRSLGQLTSIYESATCHYIQRPGFSANYSVSLQMARARDWYD